MQENRNNKTKAWELYEKGVNYNNSLTPNQYRTVETNTEFYIGNQWLHLPNTPAMQRQPKPVFNILKRVASLFIASITSSGTTVHFEPLAYYDGSNMADPQHDASVVANALMQTLFEKFKLEYRIRDALFDGAVTGDYCAHTIFDPYAKPYGGAFGQHRGEIKMELVDGINVMFGNPNSRDVQTQPYIIVVGRDTVEHLREEANRFRKSKEKNGGKANEYKGQDITSDNEYQWQTGVGGKKELIDGDETGKALYLYLYTKQTKEVDATDEYGNPQYVDEYDKDGNPLYEIDDNGVEILDVNGAPVPKRKVAKKYEDTVFVTKATRTAIIYENVDTGLSRYPIAWGNWEKQKNQYHGRALITGMLPNQISINKIYSDLIASISAMAYPTKVYNADLISRWDNAVGTSIGVHGLQPGQSISQMVTTIAPSDLSHQVFTAVDKILALTKDCLGATDAQMGNVNPENTSALMVLQTNSEVPLENVNAGKNEWIEELALNCLDMAGTDYGKRPIVIDREFTELVTGPGGQPQIDPMTGMLKTQKMVRKVVEEFDFSQFKNLELNLRVDVGATTYYSEIAMTQTLDNLRKDGTLDVIQYLERIPDKLIPKKQQLIDELRGRIADGTQMNAAAGAAIPEPGSPISAKNNGQGGPIQGGPVSAEIAKQGLPQQSEAGFDNLPNIAKKTALAQGAQRVR